MKQNTELATGSEDGRSATHEHERIDIDNHTTLDLSLLARFTTSAYVQSIHRLWKALIDAKGDDLKKVFGNSITFLFCQWSSEILTHRQTFFKIVDLLGIILFQY